MESHVHAEDQRPETEPRPDMRTEPPSSENPCYPAFIGRELVFPYPKSPSAHRWRWVVDWEGDPRYSHTRADISHWECVLCGEESDAPGPKHQDPT